MIFRRPRSDHTRSRKVRGFLAAVLALGAIFAALALLSAILRQGAAS